MTATNMTGVVLAIIIFSFFTAKSFFKPIYAIWVVFCIVAIPLGIRVALDVYPYKGQVISGAINVILYGFILIHVFFDLFTTRKIVGLRIPICFLWLIMLVIMFLSVNENIWPIWFAIIFGLYYVSDITLDTDRNIYMSIPDGIILGFFFIQGMALVFRPYDLVRYVGLYVNPNFNAMFYLMSYSSFLCKWFVLKKQRKYPLLRVLLGLFAGSMYGFTIFTGSKSAILAMLLITLIFALLLLRYCKHKIISFIGIWMGVGMVSVISIPIVYCAIRYLPTVHLHPLYFEGEYSVERVQPGESSDSEKYISFRTAMETNLGRFFYKFPNLEEYVESFFVLKVHAAEVNEFQEPEYIYSMEEVWEGIDPVEMRQQIHKYYFERLNWVGHKNDYDGAPISVYYTAPHAHNVFIQIAFLYGIPAGIMFVLMIMSFIPGCICLVKAGDDFRVCVISCFVIAFVIFGFFEIDWMCGQLPFTMLFLLFRDVVRKPQELQTNW